MNPKLIVISGGPQGATFELTDQEITIGREAANHICLVDPSVSRRHAVLKREGDSFTIFDLESLNGTLVNDVPISERQLEHGDRVTIGDILVLFLLHELDSGPTVPAIHFSEDNLPTQSLVLRRQDAFYLSDEKVLAALSPTERVARDLHTLLKISTAVNSAQDLLQMQRRVLELIFEVVPAERGAIVLAKNADELTPSASYVRQDSETTSIVVSRTVATQALRERVSILVKDVASDPSFAQAPSVIASEARAILCSPLVVHDAVEGVIYLDTRAPSVSFDEHHLQLLMAIAGIAAMAIQTLRDTERLASENLRLSEELNIKHTMIGESPRMRDLYRFIAKVAPSDAGVLFRGESGTGKELAARAVHTNSGRASGPFVAINCATLNDTLLESELFGHEKGAFTGAIGLKRGKLEIAEGGTLFLDEVGELSPAIQAKLLRVLQEREFERVGGTRPIKIDIRVVAATNRDLEADIRDGKFRQDLYYRLNVISFTLPPLRERREDIPLLANYFASESSKRARRRTVRLSTEARSYLLAYHWPGNVRELQNAIERAVVLGSTDLIMAEDLPESILDKAPSAQASSTTRTFYDALRETKKRLIIDALRLANGSFTEAARHLGVHPNNLHRLVRNMKIKFPHES